MKVTISHTDDRRKPVEAEAEDVFVTVRSSAGDADSLSHVCRIRLDYLLRNAAIPSLHPVIAALEVQERADLFVERQQAASETIAEQAAGRRWRHRAGVDPDPAGDPSDA